MLTRPLLPPLGAPQQCSACPLALWQEAWRALLGGSQCAGRGREACLCAHVLEQHTSFRCQAHSSASFTSCLNQKSGSETFMRGSPPSPPSNARLEARPEQIPHLVPWTGQAPSGQRRGRARRTVRSQFRSSSGLRTLTPSELAVLPGGWGRGGRGGRLAGEVLCARWVPWELWSLGARWRPLLQPPLRRLPLRCRGWFRGLRGCL